MKIKHSEYFASARQYPAYIEDKTGKFRNTVTYMPLRRGNAALGSTAVKCWQRSGMQYAVCSMQIVVPLTHSSTSLNANAHCERICYGISLLAVEIFITVFFKLLRYRYTVFSFLDYFGETVSISSFHSSRRPCLTSISTSTSIRHLSTTSIHRITSLNKSTLGHRQ